MDPRLRGRVEVETIHQLLPELDCYQVLELPPGSAQADIDNAFRAVSRRLHPDRTTTGASAEYREKANAVFKAVNDAYKTLRDPETRAAYDAERKGGALRMSAEARKQAEADAAARADPSRAAKTDKGSRYWRTGLQSFHDGQFQQAVMHMQFALNYEPGNAIIKEWLDKAKVEMEKQRAVTTEAQQQAAFKHR
jgi:curved DNA-binding protein CbpA